MQCPYCLQKDTKVIDKRDIEGTIRRRRECLKCKKRFNTRENIDRTEIKVRKKDGRIENFDQQKLRKGIEKACEKRPVNPEEINKMIANVEKKLLKRGKEVKSSFIGDLVSNELRKVDKVAYIRFASVYKDFTELDDFKKEIKDLIKK